MKYVERQQLVRTFQLLDDNDEYNHDFIHIIDDMDTLLVITQKFDRPIEFEYEQLYPSELKEKYGIDWDEALKTPTPSIRTGIDDYLKALKANCFLKLGSGYVNEFTDKFKHDLGQY